MATITGTANKDVLYIDKGKSNDTLLGLAGNDYLDALSGAGNNILRGGEGDDELYAYTNDQLFGDAGDDKLYSDGNGANTLSGGDGNDIIYAIATIQSPAMRVMIRSMVVRAATRWLVAQVKMYLRSSMSMYPQPQILLLISIA